MTTVLQPCQVYFESTQSPTSPQAMEVTINALSLKVFVLLILHVAAYFVLQIEMIVFLLQFQLLCC